MFDISWGELVVLGVVGVGITGRKDLPKTFRFVGSQVGRVVGLLQGARVRADQYAAKNELNQLQNELRSGLRELDQVRMELAVAASSQGIVGRNLGPMTASANKNFRTPPATATTPLQTQLPHTDMGVSASPAINTRSPHATTSLDAESSTFSFDLPNDLSDKISLDDTISNSSLPSSNLSSRQQYQHQNQNQHQHSELAALEEEWEKQGIGYQTRAEQMYQQQKERQLQQNTSSSSSFPSPSSSSSSSGSELLANLIKQNLLWDQYDRVVQEQDQQVQQRMHQQKERMRQKNLQEDDMSQKDQ